MSAPPLPIATIERRLKVLAEHGGNVSRAAQALGISRGSLQNTVASQCLDRMPRQSKAPGRLHYELEQGSVVVFSDCHWWPNQPLTTANRALLHFCKALEPKAVIGNGDLVDGATISRHPPICWERRPALVDELDTVVERLGEIMFASPNAQRFWPCGNHDARVESRLAQVAPEYARIKGVHLKDHMPSEWEPCWSVHINNNTVVKHRDKNTRVAAKDAAMNMVQGHRHSLAVYPVTSLGLGTRWSVDTGTLADPFGPQFEYMEDGQRDHRSGFVILNYYDHQLVWPEVVFVADEAAGVVHFRGRVIHV